MLVSDSPDDTVCCTDDGVGTIVAAMAGVELRVDGKPTSPTSIAEVAVKNSSGW
jgi:hypothetical protein